MYLAISIGNTDNKLTQQEWNDFVEEMIDAIGREGKVHFFGGSATYAPWQNVAWIIETDKNWKVLNKSIIKIRRKYKQESVFILQGNEQFI